MQLRLIRSILLLATLFALVGCESSDPTPTPTVVPTAEPTPIPTTVYRVAAEFDAITLDPARANGLEDRWAAGELLFNQLFAIDTNGALQPELAERLPDVSPDGLVLTLTLRSGVRFHDGQPLTADDVKFTLERVLQPATGSWGVDGLRIIAGADAVANGAAAELAGATVINPQTLRLSLTRPASSLAATLSASAYSIVPRAAVQAAGSRWGHDVVTGTGPFHLKDWQIGQSLTLDKNLNYFKAGLPKLDSVVINFNVVPFVGVDQLTAEQADFVSLSSADDLNRKRESLGGRLMTTPSTMGMRIVFNPNNEAVRNPLLRKAVATALNKAALVRRYGLGTLAQGVLPPALPQYDAAFTSTLTFDRERARAFLLEAGYPNGIARWLILSDAPREQLEVIQADLRDIGIETEIISSGAEDVLGRLASGEIAFTYEATALPVADAYAAVQLARAGCTAEMQCDAEVDALLAQAETLPLDSAERTRRYREIESRIVNNDVTVVPVLWLDGVGLGRAAFTGDAPDPIDLLPALETADKTN